MLGQYETRISKGNLSQILHRNMTPAEMIDFLEKGAVYRSFADVLRAVYPGEDLAQRLRDGLLELSGAYDKKEADVLRKNVSNWLKGSSTPQNREQLFKICFALGLSEGAANKVLASAAETGIHYRNPKELVYAFALRTGMSYPDAVALDREMAALYGPAVEAAETRRAEQWKEREKRYRSRRPGQSGQEDGADPAAEEPTFLTQQTIRRFEGVASVEDLRLFFAEHSADLGTLHESAYEKFWKLLFALQEPDDVLRTDGGREESYSLDRIAEEYFRMNVPQGRNTKQYGYLQKAMKKNWPGATELNKMKNRKTDVSRKALLLLFLITEDFLFSEDLQYSDKASEDAAWYIPEEDESPRDQLEVVLSKINLFLETYGMNQLDPGNPFDCLILYALAAAYDEAFLSDAFSAALKALFSAGEEASAGH